MPSSTKDYEKTYPSTSSGLTFTYLGTFKICLQDTAAFLRRTGKTPKPVLKDVLDEFEKKVKPFPLSCPVSPSLESLGIMKYRECLVQGYRILYALDDKNNSIDAYAIISQKQDIKNLLYRRLIQP